MDWYFLKGYSMVMDEEPSDSMFRSFMKENQRSIVTDEDYRLAVDADELEDFENAMLEAETATQAASRKKAAAEAKAKQSKAISKYFKDILSAVAEQVDIFETALAVGMTEEEEIGVVVDNSVTTPSPFAQAPFAESLVGDGLSFNPLLTSHGPKRMAVNSADENPRLKTSWICFRAGWMTKSMHTVFDYLDFSSNNDQQVARSLAHWNDNGYGSTLAGGRPPSLDTLIGTGEDGLALKFADHLFFR